MIGPGAVQPFRELVDEVIDPALLLVNGGQQFVGDPLQQRGIVRQAGFGIRGSVRHAPSTHPPAESCAKSVYFAEAVSTGRVYRTRRFAFSATPPRIKDNSVALIVTPAASPITFGNSNVPASRRFCHRA